MESNYLKSFIVGSSFPVFIGFFLSVSQFDPKVFHFNYEHYTFIAPLFLGLANVVFLYIQQLLNLTTTMRFLLMSIISPLIVLAVVYSFDIYTYTSEDWKNHIIKMLLAYGVICNLIIPTIEANI